MISPLCDPDVATFWFNIAVSVVIAGAVGFSYGRWARSHVLGGGLIDCQRWPVVIMSIALPVVGTFLAFLFYDAVFPSVEHCGSTDRHVLPFSMALSTFPVLWIGALAGAWRAPK